MLACHLVDRLRPQPVRAAGGPDRLHPGVRWHPAAHHDRGQGGGLPPHAHRGAASTPSVPGRSVCCRSRRCPTPSWRPRWQRTAALIASGSRSGLASLLEAARPARPARRWSTRRRSPPSPSPPPTARKASPPSPSDASPVFTRRSRRHEPASEPRTVRGRAPPCARDRSRSRRETVGAGRSRDRRARDASPASRIAALAEAGLGGLLMPESLGGQATLHGDVRRVAGPDRRRVRIDLDRLHDPDALRASDPPRRAGPTSMQRWIPRVVLRRGRSARSP